MLARRQRQQPGATRNFLVGKADLDGFMRSLEFNEFGHCLVSRFVGRLGELYHLPTSLYQQWPQLLLHRYGLGAAESPSSDAAKPPAREQLAADTPRTTLDGATFIAPIGWWIETRTNAIVLTAEG